MIKYKYLLLADKNITFHCNNSKLFSLCSLCESRTLFT